MCVHLYHEDGRHGKMLICVWFLCACWIRLRATIDSRAWYIELWSVQSTASASPIFSSRGGMCWFSQLPNFAPNSSRLRFDRSNMRTTSFWLSKTRSTQPVSRDSGWIQLKRKRKRRHSIITKHDYKPPLFSYRKEKKQEKKKEHHSFLPWHAMSIHRLPLVSPTFLQC